MESGEFGSSPLTPTLSHKGRGSHLPFVLSVAA